MRLDQPLWLLLAALTLLLAWLHRQRRAHQIAEVGSLHLWRALAVEHAPNRARPRLSPALLLQVLVLLLLALALTRPVFGPPPATSGGVLILIDASRAMQATDVRPSRFQAAVRLAGGLLQGRSSVLLVGERSVPLAAGRRDLSALRQDLLAARAGDGQADWVAAARAARALLTGTAGTRVVALTAPSTAAAARQALRSLNLGGLNAEVRPLGGPLGNAAITRLEVTTGAAGRPWSLRGGVRLYGPATRRSLTLRLGPTVLAVQALDLTPGQETPFSLRFTPGAGGVLSAALSPDGLNADDAAQIVLRPTPRPLRVAVIGPRVEATERGLAALPGAVVVHVARPTPDADLTVVTQPRWTGTLPGPTLWLNAAPTTAASPTTPLAWDPRSPLGRGVSWSDLTVQRAAVTAWPGAQAVLTGPDGPLIETRGEGTHWEVRVNLATAEGPWTRSPAFPIFLSNVARLIRPDAGQPVVPPCDVGEPCALPLGAATLSAPDGRPVPLAGATFLPEQAGVYRLDGAPLAVTRLAGPEADLTATGGPARGAATPPGPASSGFTGLSGWSMALLLGLALLLAEGLLAIRAEPALRRLDWRRVRRHTRQMLALHALAALLLLLAILNVPLPAPGQPPAVAVVRLPGSAEPTFAAVAGQPAVQVWGTAAPTLTAPPAGAKAGDLASALELAAAALPGDAERSILLTGNRWPTSAALSSTLARLRQQDIRVNAVPSGPAAVLDLLALDAPGRVDRAQPFKAEAVINAAKPVRVQVTLRRGDILLFTQTLALPAGPTRLTLPLRETVEGTAGYTLRLAPATGSAVTGTFATRVQAAPRVAVVGDDPAAGAVVVRALVTQGLDAAFRSPDQLPAAGLGAFRSVVLLGVAARTLSPALRSALFTFVQGGGRLLIGGGPSSFGPGGYLGTPLETLSPLSSRVQRDAPRIALGLILDKSGSMNEAVGHGLTKLDLIKAAALSASALLQPQSDVSVVAFDTSPKIAVPLQRASNQPAIRAQITRIEAEGGTVVMRALDASLKQLTASGASQKHMILLTDGIDGGIFNAQEYERRVRRILATGITVSTVAVGSGMHIPLMRDIAAWGGGTFNHTEDWQNVPSLLTQDTLNQGRPALALTPAALHWQDRLAENSVVGGYVHTTLKPGATLLASVGETSGAGASGAAEPLAAVWQVGLGSVTAVATELAGGWANRWTARPEYPATLAFLTRAGHSQEAQELPALLAVGDDLSLRARTPRLTLDGPAGPLEAALHVSSQGGYHGWLYAPPAGGYSAGTGPGSTAATGLLSAVPRPELPGMVTAATGGQLLQAPAAAAGRPRAAWSWRSGWVTFTLLALLSFLLGLAVRYLRAPDRPGRIPGLSTRSGDPGPAFPQR